MQRVGVIAEVVSAVVVAASLILAILAYLDRVDQQQRQFTFEITTSYQEGDIAEARSELFSYIYATQLRASPAVLGRSDLSIMIEKSLFGSNNEASVLDALFRTTSFYNSAADCVGASLCDADILRMVLSGDAKDLLDSFGPTIAKLSDITNVDHLDRGLAFLASQEEP